MTAGFQNILIVGIGLIGGSLAGALKKLDPALRVYGAGSSEETLRIAREAGLIEQENPPAYKDIDLVVLASPINSFESWFKTLAENGYEGVVTDTASAKLPVVRAAAKTLKNPGCFIPGHPMAGREKSGVLAAKDDLFEGAYWLLTPGEAADMHVYRRLHTLLTAIGARVLSVDAAEHDKLVAVISHVPHVAASSLVMLAAAHSGANGELFRLAAGGFKDTTRVAAGDPALWTGILCSNADMIAAELKEYADIISRFAGRIGERDGAEVERMLAGAAAARKSIPAKWVPETGALIEITVLMDNRPGVIAAITEAAGRSGCNIQAIDIEHQTERRAALRLILTDEGDVAGLMAALEALGFEAQSERRTD
ncbi:MAG: prephenate dehydrogenase/arogenate dehydrogenase family protein [Clostridiales Family XIII bacterium]|jgi:prephenate dehydrogenase|nr:prephenate dehydrogenase/arogenate dehydrogenase family protein [Clostridiales Family XIII bacterium]